MSFLKYHLPLIIYAALIFYLSSIPNLSNPLPSFNWSDKVVHFVEFAVLGVLIWQSARRLNMKVRRRWLVMLAIAVGIFYAASDEFHQSFVAGRNADLLDWIADSLGLVIGTVSMIFLAKNGSKPGLNGE